MPTSIAGRALAVAVLVAIAMAWASPTLGDEDHAAIVIKEGSAVLLDAARLPFTTTNMHKVVTQSKNGNVLLKVIAKGVPNSTGKAVHWDFNSTGLRCSIVLPDGTKVRSPNWQETISAGGNAIFICHFKAPKAK